MFSAACGLFEPAQIQHWMRPPMATHLTFCTFFTAVHAREEQSALVGVSHAGGSLWAGWPCMKFDHISGRSARSKIIPLKNFCSFGVFLLQTISRSLAVVRTGAWQHGGTLGALGAALRGVCPPLFCVDSLWVLQLPPTAKDLLLRRTGEAVTPWTPVPWKPANRQEVDKKMDGWTDWSPHVKN